MGLDIKRASVHGQIQPGLPVWQCGPERRYPGMTYIVFPGNVGDVSSLVEVVTMASLQDPQKPFAGDNHVKSK